jgi:hypothetical protein
MDCAGRLVVVVCLVLAELGQVLLLSEVVPQQEEQQ